MATTATKVTAEEVKAMIGAAAESFDASGLVQGDEQDNAAFSLAIAVPEKHVAILIGHQGSNISEIKAVCGVQFSFTKIDTSAGGFRRAFLSGPMASVVKAVAIATNVVVSQGAPCSAGLIVANKAAGPVIGKGAENLKSIRELSGAKVNMEKPHESPPGFVGRTLTLAHESPDAVIAAVYQSVRLQGFASPKQSDKGEGDAMGYGPMGSTGGMGARFSPYAQAGGKGSAQPDGAGSALASLGQFGAATYGGLGMGGMGGFQQQGGQFGQAGQMGQMGMGGYGGLQLGGGFGAAPQQGGALVCATHSKKRGATNLQPHSSMPGLFVCRTDDACK